MSHPAQRLGPTSRRGPCRWGYLPSSRAFWLTGVLLAGLTGCSHYRLGTSGRLAFTTLYVAPVEDRALLPQAQSIVATAVREALLKDGRVSVSDSPGTADVVLHIALTKYERIATAANPADTGLAREFALRLRASCTLTDRSSGQPLFRGREVMVTRSAYTDSGQLQAEYQTLPLLADALADRIAHTILDVW